MRSARRMGNSPGIRCGEVEFELRSVRARATPECDDRET